MRAVSFLFTLCCVIGLAFWAYRENYATQQLLAHKDDLHQEIRTAHARLAVLRAEWAYLNRPDRLRDLVELNFDKLGLLPLAPEQFGTMEQVADPAPVIPALDLSHSVDLSFQEQVE